MTGDATAAGESVEDRKLWSRASNRLECFFGAFGAMVEDEKERKTRRYGCQREWHSSYTAGEKFTGPITCTNKSTTRRGAL